MKQKILISSILTILLLNIFGIIYVSSYSSQYNIYENYTKPNISEVQNYVNWRSKGFEQKATNVRGNVGGRGFICLPDGKTGEFDCEWITNNFTAIPIFEEAMIWTNLTKREIKTPEIYPIIFRYIFRIIYIPLYSLKYNIEEIPQERVYPNYSDNEEHKRIVYEALREEAASVTNAHEYRMHVFDCTDFSRELRDRLKEKEFSARCVFGILKGANYPLHTWIEVDVSGNVIPIEATAGEIIDKDFYAENYRAMAKGACV